MKEYIDFGERTRKRRQEAVKASGTEGGYIDFGERVRKKRYYQTLDTSGVNADYLSGFVTDAQGFVSDMRGDTPVALAQARERAADLNTRYDTIQAHLYKNRGSMTPEDYEGYSKALEGLSELGGIADFYGRFASEEDYQAWLANDRFERETMGLEDFEEFSGIGAGIVNPTYDPWKSQSISSDGKRLVNLNGTEDIGNIVTFVKSLPEEHTVGKIFRKNVFVNSEERKNYRYMNDNEVAIYNYYLGKGDVQRADEYLQSLREKLIQREGQDIYESVTGNRFYEMLNAFHSGLENFSYGIGNLDNWFRGGDPDPLSASQYASSMIRNDMIRDDGTGGGWDIAYDLTSTTANMLPSILLSYVPVVGQAAGLVSMGASATGNAYAEMKRLGYNDWQARGYSLAVGVSEAVLEKVLGGIGKLTGGSSKGVFQTIAGKVLPRIDNALARIAIDLGSNMLDEGMEEALQSVLEPIFKELATAASIGDVEIWETLVNMDWDEVIYSGLLGMLSAGVLEGLPTVIGNVQASRVYKQARELYGNGVEAALVAEALALNPDSRLAKKLKARLDKKRKVSGAELYELLQENRAAIKKIESGEAEAPAEVTPEITAEETASPSEEGSAETPTETAAEATEADGQENGSPADEIAVDASVDAEVIAANGLTVGQVAPRFKAAGEAGWSLTEARDEAIRSGILFAGVSKEAMDRLVAAYEEGLAAREAKEGKTIVQNAEKPVDSTEKGNEDTGKSQIGGTMSESNENHDLTVLRSWGCSDDEIRSFLQYKSSESYRINEKLYTGAELSDSDLQMVRALDQALERFPRYEGVVYRNLIFDGRGDDAPDALMQYVNTHLTDGPSIYESYTSSSKAKDGYVLEGDYVVHLTINSLSGRDVSALGVAEEQEVLFPRGAIFFVDNVSRDENGHVHITLQEASEHDGVSEEGRGDPDQRGGAVRDLQESPQEVSDLRGISEGGSHGDTAGTARPQGALPGGQRNSVRSDRSRASAGRTVQGEADVLSDTPSGQVASYFLDRFRAGVYPNKKVLEEKCAKAFGGTLAEGAYTVKDSYDALELAVNLYLKELAKDFNTDDPAGAVQALSKLEELVGNLPTQTNRTAEQERFQQFSTPPTIAYLAAWAANIEASDVVLEPSAGIGGLAVYPQAWGAQVAVNELDERRRGVLSHMGFDTVTGEDARYIQDVPALAGVKPSVVLMNPPFSSQATTGMAANTSTSFEHVEAALEKLSDGGRLVTVLGAGRDGVDSKQFTAWMRKLKKDYTVRANVVIDGRNYRKYGTDFNVRIVVIDKIGAHTGETVTGSFTNLNELPGKLKGVRDARESGRAGFESDRGLAGDTGGVRKDPRVSGAERAVGDAHAGAGVPVDGGSVGARDGTHGGGGEPSSRGAVSGTHDTARRGDGGVERSRSHGAGRSGESDADRVRAGEGSPAADHAGSGGSDAGQLRGVDQRRGDAGSEAVTAPASESTPTPAKDYKAGTSKKKVKDTGVYSDYVAPSLPVKGLKAHPAVLVESSAMASVQAPKATYKPHLPQESINSGVWSGEQMVNIVYAGQAHAQTLPNGTRKGYLIGDGTGVGKGRQIAGIIMDNLAQGRKRAVWVSNNSPLYEDAIRDWTAVGGDKADVMLYERSKAGKRAGKDGILFTTYSTLGAKPRTGMKDMESNLDKIVAWLGEDFDGVIAFDEAHNMANAIPKKGGWGQQKPADKALAGLELQRRLPKARVVYVSATAATSVGELAYAERLGLWGEGTAFRDRETFLDKLMQAGTAGMELVARDMKAMGVYNARSISYDGVQYDTLRHKLTRQQKDMYDKMSDAWQIVMQNVENAMVVTGANKDGKARGRYLSGLYGSLQRFYQQILCALSMPSVIEDIRRELDAGHSCVLQIVNTNEAQENRTKAAAKETDADLEELDFSPRNILIDYLMNAFPVTRYEEYMDEDGNKRSREVKDADGKPVISQKAVAMRDDLIAQIEALSIPDNPLDMLYRAFGVDNVAEITGRSSRVVPLPDENGEMHLVDQKRGKAATSADVEAFQNGDKHILVFSDAGGTGKSYHADRSAKNQQKRIHYLIQPGWNATKAVQGFGRTHRSNQVSAPIYKLVTTDIAGQARFISTIAKRLDNLGAMTKGQRQAGSGFFSAADNLESDLAAQTLFTFYKMLDRGAYGEFSGREIIRKLGLERKLYTHEGYLNVESSDMMDVSLFLNRVLSLRFDEQNALFGHFVDLLTQFTEEAEEKGVLDKGMENVRADRAELVDEKIIREYENGGEPTKFLRIKTYTKARIEPSVKRIEKVANDFLGIYRDTKGQARAIFALADKTEMNGAVTKRYRVQSPNMGRHGVIDGATMKKYTRVSTDDMQAAWDEAVAAMPEYDVRDTYMVTGALLPIWDRLSDANIKVQRITLDSGERYLGRVINQTQADQLLRQFGQSRKAEKLTGEQIVNTVIGEGRVVSVEKMYSGYDLTRARVSGENRIEVVGNKRQQAKYDIDGVIEEKIGSEYRYFIPVGEKGAAMLDGLIRNGARVSVKEESGAEGLRARKNVSSVEAQKPRAAVSSRDESEWTPTEIPDGERNVEHADVVPVSLSELTSLIQERFGVHITVGHLRTRGNDGEYDAKTGGMRVKLANDLPSIAHELGHHLEREFGLGDFEERNRSVLESVLTPEMRNAYKQELRASEGFAEFLRRYIIDRDGAELEFGRDAEGKSSETSLFCQFETAMDEKTLSDLREVSDLVYALLNDTSVSSAEAIHRQRSHMETFFTFTSAAVRALRDKEYRGELLTDAKDTVRASITEQTRILREGVTAQDIGKSWYARFMTRWVDRNYLLYEIGRASGNYNAEAYVYAQNAAYAGGVAFANAVDTEFCDIDGKVVGESLGAILKPLYTEERKGKRFFSKMDYAKFDAFNEYLVVRHAPERMAEGMKIFGNPRLDTPEYCEARQAELEAEYPEFSDMAMRLYEFQTSMLKTWAVQTGIVSASMADEWGKRWNNYVPLQRVMDDKINARGRAAKKSFANQKSPWHRAVGSTRDIVAPVDSIVTTLTNLVSISHRNRVMLSLTATLKSMPDSSFLMERIPAHVKRETVDTTAAKDSMLEDMMENGMDGELSMAIMELVNKYFDDTMERFTRKAKPGEPDEITVLKGGKAELWQVNNRELFEVVAGLQGETRNGILKLFEKLTRFQVGALTGSNLAWSLRSNIFRDIQAAGTYLMGDINYLSRDGIKTAHKEVARRWVSLIQGYGKSFVSSFRDTYGHGSEDVYWREMMAQGGSDAALWASDKRASLRVQKEIEKSVATKLSPFRFVSCVSEAIEKGPRYAAYKLYRQSGAEPSYAFYRAMDLTVNFKRGGTVSKDVTKVIPFFNASVQGLDRMVRYFTGQQIDENMQIVHGEARKQLILQRAILTVASAVIGAALAQFLRYQDKEDYDRLSTYTQNNFWCIPIPGSHNFVTIPKPRELTVLQSGLERGLDYILGDEHAYDEFGEYAIGTLTPPIVSDILQIPSDGLEDATFGALSSVGIIGPAVEIYANKNFLGQPIIPSYLEDVLPEDQYKQSTSLLAYWLGNTALGRGLGLSPVGIDHFGESVLGGYWELHKSLLPLNGDYRDVTVGFGSSIVRNSAYSTDIANRLYDGKEAAMLESNSDPESLDKKITYKWYDTAASFYSRYGKLAKETKDGAQAEDDRLRALEHVESFLSVMESGGKVAGQDELEAYVRATGDTTVMPGVMQTFIKYGEDGAFDRELALDAKDYIEFQGKYNELYWKYAAKALSGKLSEEQRGEALQAARDQALIEAKNYLLGLHGYSSKRYKQTTGYDAVKSVGVSLTDYAKVKQFWREAVSDKDKNGQTVSGSKRDKVAKYIDSLRLSDRKKDALYLAMGYSENTLKDAPWH